MALSSVWLQDDQSGDRSTQRHRETAHEEEEQEAPSSSRQQHRRKMNVPTSMRPTGPDTTIRPVARQCSGSQRRHDPEMERVSAVVRRTGRESEGCWGRWSGSSWTFAPGGPVAAKPMATPTPAVSVPAVCLTGLSRHHRLPHDVAGPWRVDPRVSAGYTRSSSRSATEATHGGLVVDHRRSCGRGHRCLDRRGIAQEPLEKVELNWPGDLRSLLMTLTPSARDTSAAS
jgi:hypothetical protein